MNLTNTRLDTCFMKLICVHMVVAKHVERCLTDTIEYGHSYARDQRNYQQGYDDSKWVGSFTNRKRTLACCKKQTSVALSATKDEYIAAEKKAKEDSSSDEEYVL